jgi:hypothetical protein
VPFIFKGWNKYGYKHFHPFVKTDIFQRWKIPLIVTCNCVLHTFLETHVLEHFLSHWSLSYNSLRKILTDMNLFVDLHVYYRNSLGASY